MSLFNVCFECTFFSFFSLCVYVITLADGYLSIALSIFVVICMSIFRFSNFSWSMGFHLEKILTNTCQQSVGHLPEHIQNTHLRITWNENGRCSISSSRFFIEYIYVYIYHIPVSMAKCNERTIKKGKKKLFNLKCCLVKWISVCEQRTLSNKRVPKIILKVRAHTFIQKFFCYISVSGRYLERESLVRKMCGAAGINVYVEGLCSQHEERYREISGLCYYSVCVEIGNVFETMGNNETILLHN